MPSLRFTRDKRGYETTSLVHAGRRNGRSRQRILYWFRTPPGVKVGRPALDEDAIRWIEEHNPDIEFDWPKILEAQPPACAARGRCAQAAGRKRDRPRPATRGARPARRRHADPGTGAGTGTFGTGTLGTGTRNRNRELEPWNWNPELEPLAQAFEQLTHPEAEEKIEPRCRCRSSTTSDASNSRACARATPSCWPVSPSAAETPSGSRHCATQAESLNPDTWVTDEEVRQGIESFEPKIRDLRAALGLRRRRRSRRGGTPSAGGVSGEGGAAVRNADQSPKSYGVTRANDHSPSPLLRLAILLSEFSTHDNNRFAPWLVAGFLAVVPVFGDAPHAQQPAAAQQPAPAAPCRAARAEPDLPDIRQPRQLGRHRPQPARAVPGRSHERRFRGLRGRRQAGAQLVYARARRARVPDAVSAAAAPVREGIILPPSRPVNDAAGRIIIFVIDDLHLEFRDTHRVRRLFRDMAKELIHDGDLFGIVSTGTSSIAIDLDLRPHAHGRSGQQDYRRRV